jgi:hypothetical protein
MTALSRSITWLHLKKLQALPLVAAHFKLHETAIAYFYDLRWE